MVTRRKVLQGSLVLAGACAVPAARAQPGSATSPHRLWYDAPAKVWTEALPVGNGRIGAMVFGGTGTERLPLNEDTLWSGGPYHPVNPKARGALDEVRRLIAGGRYADAHALADSDLMARPLQQMAYQTFGDLTLKLGDGADLGYGRELDLDSATATTRFRRGGARHVRRVVASPLRQVIAVHHACDAPAGFDVEVLLAPAQDMTVTAESDMLLARGRNRGEHGVAGALQVAGAVLVSHEGGRIEAAGEGLRVIGARSVTLLVALATSYRSWRDVSGDPEALVRGWIAAAAPLGFERLHSEAVGEHRRLYRRVDLQLGSSSGPDLPTDRRLVAAQGADDPALAALYFNYARYLLIASSRPGSQPANLQGIWNDSNSPPWGSKYTININTEMNYWPAEAAALPECVEPLVRMVRELAESGARTAREMYGARGWVAHHNTDLWRATAPIDGARWGLWPVGGAWLCTHLWRHWDYGRDVAFLRQVYPVMRGAAEFFVDTLQTDPRTGFLVVSPSLSPENAHRAEIAVCAGPASDQQIVRDLFEQTAQAAKILQIDPEFAAELRALRARLAPDKIGAQGQLQEWQEDWDAAAPDPQHRHVSHLYALYPGDQIDLDRTPEFAAAARRTLELRGDESTGWATAWRANLWARLRNGEHAHRILRYLLGPERTYPNLFDAHPPFQIDGNFGGAAAVMEMLVQGRGDTIHLLPALPKAWAQGSVRGLRLPGACGIDLAWSDGRPSAVTLRSASDQDRVVRFGDRIVNVRLKAGRKSRVDLRPFA